MRVIDFTEFSYEDLVVLINSATQEKRRRDVIESAETRAEAIVEEYTKAVGRKDGDPWVQPTGAHDSFRINSKVEHKGKIWVSSVPNNIWEPGVSGWKEEVVVDEETGETTYPPYNQPTGGHDAYNIGDRITWTDGKVYESTMNGNVWTPVDYPAGWKMVA